MRIKKPYQELELHDAFMFAAAMEDEDICREIIERILEIPVKKVRVHTEHTVFYNSDYRGIRMDVFANDDEGTVYNVEMQTTDKKELARRSRFYLSRMDSVALKPGDKFFSLPQTYVIFICTFDPFGKDLYRYTFKNQCVEGDISLEDGTSKIFLNTKGKIKELVPEALVNFLNYIECTNQGKTAHEDILLDKLNNRISYIKNSRGMEERYMLFGEMLDDEREAGKLEGREEGQAQIFLLISAMTADGHLNDVPRLQTEPEYLQKMLAKYHIS